MDVTTTELSGVLLFRPRPFRDGRGFFTRTFDADVARSAGVDPTAFVQDSQSRSSRGTIRGLHFRTDGREAKLVRCSYGSVHDVVVDLRPRSATFGRWQAFRLDDREHHVVYIPPGCAHGFAALTEPADVCYRMDAPYAPELDGSVAWDDADLGVHWPFEPETLSTRDRSAPSFASLRADLERWFGAPPPDRAQP